jgi:hypothetical protein
MSDRNLFTVWKVVFAVLVLFFLVDAARAYVGPGAGLELVGYAMSLAAWVGVAFSALFLYPIYALVRRLRGRKADTKITPLAVSVPSAAESSEYSPIKQ